MPTKLNDCGCCEGITAIVPESLFNRPGLSQVRYRVGTQADFLRSALAALSELKFSALHTLTTRELDDFTIALLDSWATLADVLTFYQERIANELWLRTATERDSILRLAQLIGYRLKAGVAAETPLCFLLDETPGAPTEVTVAEGNKVQSVPGANEKPQTFETIEELEARVAWNVLKPRLKKPIVITAGLKEAYLKGTATNLAPGDALLFVGDERVADHHSNHWNFVLLLTVTADTKNDRTHVTWKKGLVQPPVQNVKVYAFRQLAARFGHNAPDPSLVTNPNGGAIGTWAGFDNYGSPMDLDSAYPKIVVQSWTVFVNTDGNVQLYRIKAVAFHSRADFALSGKVTRIALDITDHLNLFGRRNTIIYAQSEELSFADVPLHSAVNGNSVIVDRKVDGLTEGRLLLFAGVDSLTSEPLTDLVGIKKVELTGSLTKITFASVASPAPPKSYVRDSLVIYGNVARSTHGETVSEVLGTGDGSKANQSFKLKQAPALTYTRSTAPGGAESSLQIRVNDLLWHEVPSLFKRGPRERIFTTEMADNGTVTVRFGDGVRGARLPSGAQNVKATYRRGSGLDGLVRAGQLTSLLTRPPGLKSVLNSLAAEGADEPESFANAQQNAPLTVLTLERVVSLEDYENFSRSYAGIAKALATWTWDGRTRGVFLTLAAPLGAAVSNSLIADLITAIHASGDPFVPVRAVSYQKALFRITGKIKVDPDYEAEKVLAAANDTLRDAFSFAKRQFGQPVNLSEVIALVQAVAGVVAVDIDSLYRTGATVKLNSRLEAELPHGGDPASLGAAELLTLDPAPIDLKVMP
ncbi:MAG: putative baseplate assembly protein [Verrucomicrobia bacterium]|nr:MAG: putative baseplate assembly protein [Verrucomicrobiota bacterium]